MLGMLRMMEEDVGVARPREDKDRDMDAEREERGILTLASELDWEPNDLIRLIWLIITKRSLDDAGSREGREMVVQGGVGRR